MAGLVIPTDEPVFDGPDTAQADLLADPLVVPTIPFVTLRSRTLETITGNLSAFSQLEPGTLLHADELMAQQELSMSLRDQTFYVADFALYSLEGKTKTPTLWLARHNPEDLNNLILNHLDDAANSSSHQLRSKKHYYPLPQEAEKVKDSSSTLKINLTKLPLIIQNENSSYLEINPTDYLKLKVEAKKLAEIFYGQDEAFDSAMDTLSRTIAATRVYVLNPAYVEKAAADAPIGNFSWRYSFQTGAYCLADGSASNTYASLLGLRRSFIPAGSDSSGAIPSSLAAQLDYEAAYQLIIKNSKLLNQDKAAGLSRILADYLSATK